MGEQDNKRGKKIFPRYHQWRNRSSRLHWYFFVESKETQEERLKQCVRCKECYKINSLFISNRKSINSLLLLTKRKKNNYLLFDERNNIIEKDKRAAHIPMSEPWFTWLKDYDDSKSGKSVNPKNQD